MSSPRQAVILAGGRGMRLRPLTDRIPKPMIPVNGRPFIEYVVEMLRDQGIARILFLLGYLPDPVVEYFGDGSRFGLEIEYAVSPEDDETGTRLRNARDRIDPLFLLAYCDNYWPVPLAALHAAFVQAARPAMLTVYRNRDGYTRDNVQVSSHLVEAYDKSRTAPDLAGVDIGYGIFERSILDLIPANGNPSFEATVYPRLVAGNRLAAFETDHRYYSIGSIERIASAEVFLRRRKTVLVDRDGTLNVRMPRAQYVTRWDDWQWIPGALQALADLTTAGYRICVLTNQPGVARGAMTAEQLDAINARMISEAQDAGAHIEHVFACTHGWDDACGCRKPRPGLFFEAQRRFDLDLTRTPYVGDDDRDAEAAEAAGSPFFRVDDTVTIASVAERLLKGEPSFASAF